MATKHLPRKIGSITMKKIKRGMVLPHGVTQKHLGGIFFKESGNVYSNRFVSSILT